MTTAIAETKKVWWEQLVRKQKSIADLLPRGVNAERFVKSAYFALTRSPRLFECEPGSVFTGILKAAEAGLDLSGVSGEAYLIPYKDGKTGRLAAQFQTGYRGLLKLAHRSGKLLDVEARVVKEGDDFKVVFGTARELRHVPMIDEEDEGTRPLGAYCIARFVGGGLSVDWMTSREINRVRERAKAKDSGPWVTDWNEMAKKTVTRRASKYWPGLDEMQRAIAAEDEEGAPTRGLTIAVPEATPEKVAVATVVTNGETQKAVGPSVPIASENAEPPADDPGPVNFPSTPPDDDIGALFDGVPEEPKQSRTAEVKDKIKRGRS